MGKGHLWRGPFRNFVAKNAAFRSSLRIRFSRKEASTAPCRSGARLKRPRNLRNQDVVLQAETSKCNICMNELWKLRIPSKLKLDDSKLCWIIKNHHFEVEHKSCWRNPCPAGAQRHHPCHRWIESPAHPPAIATDFR